MTTIAYNSESNQIACDSRLSNINFVISDSYKKYRISADGIFFFTGNAADIDIFMSTYKPDSFAGVEKMDTCCLHVDTNKNVHEIYFCPDKEAWVKLAISYSSAMGSGEEWATAALDFGKTAKESVEYAVKRDYRSGGEIVVYDILTDKIL